MSFSSTALHTITTSTTKRLGMTAMAAVTALGMGAASAQEGNVLQQPSSDEIHHNGFMVGINGLSHTGKGADVADDEDWGGGGSAQLYGEYTPQAERTFPTLYLSASQLEESADTRLFTMDRAQAYGLYPVLGGSDSQIGFFKVGGGAQYVDAAFGSRMIDDTLFTVAVQARLSLAKTAGSNPTIFYIDADASSTFGAINDKSIQDWKVGLVAAMGEMPLSFEVGYRKLTLDMGYDDKIRFSGPQLGASVHF